MNHTTLTAASLALLTACGAPVTEDAEINFDVDTEMDAAKAPTGGTKGKTRPPPSYDFVFASKRAGEYDVYGAPTDGSAPVRLTTSTARDLAPTFAPDGKAVFYVSTQSGKQDLWRLDLVDGTSSPMTTGLAIAYYPAFSTDGAYVVFEGATTQIGATDVYRMNTDGTNVVRLTDDAAKDAGPVVSPDGTTVYFVSNRTGTYEIWSTSIDGGAATQVTTGSGILGKPAMSADGRRLAWSRIGTSGKSKIVVRDLATNTDTDLTENNDSEPAFSKDGTRVAFTSLRTGNPEVFVMTIATGAVAQRTNDLEIDGQAAF